MLKGQFCLALGGGGYVFAAWYTNKDTEYWSARLGAGKWWARGRGSQPSDREMVRAKVLDGAKVSRARCLVDIFPVEIRYRVVYSSSPACSAIGQQSRQKPFLPPQRSLHPDRPALRPRRGIRPQHPARAACPDSAAPIPRRCVYRMASKATGTLYAQVVPASARSLQRTEAEMAGNRHSLH